MTMTNKQIDQMKECVSDIKSRVDAIEKLSFQVLNEKRLENCDEVYKINQEAHKIKHILDNYVLFTYD